MNSIDRLIKEMCPDGVPFKPLDDFLDYEQPTKYIVESTNYHDVYSTPVLTAGQTFILGYTDEVSGIYHASPDNPVIIFDDFTTSHHWVEFDFKVKSSAMKMLTLRAGAMADFKYLYYAMTMIRYGPQDHARQWIATYSKFCIPIPPLEIQRAIVEILDRFTELEVELEVELEARRNQYHYYLKSLLTFSETVRHVRLGEVCSSITAGRNVDREASGLYAVYGSTGVIGYTNSDTYNTDSILVARVGANAGLVHMARGHYDVSDNTLRLVLNDDYLLKFAYFQLSNMNINQWAVGGGQPLITGKLLKDLLIYLPPIAEQVRIVSILDNFDALVNDMSIGLPAELAARRKQYEYYRDRLLTFKEAA